MRHDWYVNFGFWDVKRTREAHPAGHFNRLIERKVVELGGIKSLYSDSYFPRDEFARLYGGAAYAALKAQVRPAGAPSPASTRSACLKAEKGSEQFSCNNFGGRPRTGGLTDRPSVASA